MRSPFVSTTVTPCRPSSQSAPAPSTSTSRCRRSEAARSSSIAPWATIRPRAMITTSSQTSSTRSSWWLEKTTPTPAAARSRRISVIVAMPIGSRPENGSSRTSSSGSWTSAAPSWTRCWLPWERASSLSLARSPSPRRSSQRSRRGVRVARRHPVVLGEVAHLLADPHPRVQAALLRHVAEPEPGLAVDRRRRSRGSRLGRAGRGRRCSASSSSCRRRSGPGSRRGARGGGEARAVQGDDVAVALGEVLDLEHGRRAVLMRCGSVLTLPAIARSPGGRQACAPPESNSPVAVGHGAVVGGEGARSTWR